MKKCTEPTNFRFPVFLFLLAFIFPSCVKDKPILSDSSANLPVYSGDIGRIFILNEGNFGSGNGSVSYYDPYTGQTTEDYFFQQNQFKAGDVVQSMIRHNGFYYLVVNNSGKIYKLNGTFKVVGTLGNLVSPRYLIPLTGNRLLVTDLYAQALKIMDTESMQIIQHIPFGGWGERMERFLNQIFITNMKKNYLYVFSVTSQQITDSIPVDRGGSSLQTDKNGKLWLLCNGDIMQSVPGALYRINPLNHTVEWQVSFPSGNPSSLCINPTRDTLYFLLNGIYRMSINSTSLPSVPFISNNNKNFYALGIHPVSGNIYAADAKDYIQKSEIYIYRPDGNMQGKFKAGIITGNFFFE